MSAANRSEIGVETRPKRCPRSVDWRARRHCCVCGICVAYFESNADEPGRSMLTPITSELVLLQKCGSLAHSFYICKRCESLKHVITEGPTGALLHSGEAR